MASLSKEPTMQFYVYVYRDPRPSKNKQPVYVGKGTGDRDLSHWSRGSHNKPLQDFLSHLRGRDMTALVERVFETDNEQEAFAKEMQLIELYGRRDLKTGTLFNRTDGGEGPSGHVKTEAQKLVDKHGTEINWKKPEYRAKVVAAQQEAQSTPEARTNKSIASLKTWQDTEVRSKRQVGIKAGRSTEASKAKTSAQAKGQWADPEYAASQTANNKEIANRPEVKAAKAAALKAKWADPEFKKMMLDARRKKHLDSVLSV
jgi:hypothetical protein